MKKIIYLSFMCSFSSAVFAMPDLYCEYSTPDNPYYVSFKNVDHTAQIKINHKVADFGNLKCNKTPLEEGLLYNCYSVGVNDAGYRLDFYWEPDEDFTVDVFEITIAGENALVTLPCWISRS